MEYGTYYSALRKRGSYFDLKGRTWTQLSEEERQFFGEYRANEHNKSLRYFHSFIENKEILRDYIHFLYSKEILPVLVITPFTDAYNAYVLPEMKEAVLELLDSVSEDIHYVDFNEGNTIFTDADFMDTDHLNAQGAKKVSLLLTELFGT